METRQNYQDMAQKGGFAFTGLLVGAIAGGIAALLFAPQSGKKTRRFLGNKASDIADMASSTADTVSKQVSQVTSKNTANQIQNLAERFRGQAKDVAKKAEKQANKAMKSTKQQDMMMMDNGGGFNFGTMMIGMLIGAALGAGTALLTAPQSGQRTRNMIGDKASQLKDQAMNATENVRSQAMNVVQTAKDKAQSTVQNVRQTNPNPSNRELVEEVDIMENTRNRDFPL